MSGSDKSARILFHSMCNGEVLLVPFDDGIPKELNEADPRFFKGGWLVP